MLKLIAILLASFPPMTEVNIYAEYRGWGVVVCAVKFEQGWAAQCDWGYTGAPSGTLRLVNVPREGSR